MKDSERRFRFGIIFKLFFIFISLMVIFYVTTVTIFFHIKHMVTLSKEVVTTRFEVSARLEGMIDNLLMMDENQKKFRVLGKEEYRGWFLQALGDYSQNLNHLRTMHTGGRDAEGSEPAEAPPPPEPWKTLTESYAKEFSEFIEKGELPENQWLSDESINSWIQILSKARAENERFVDTKLRNIYDFGQESERLGDLGLASSVLLGFLGSLFLAYSIIRPLRELRKGIRSFSRDGIMKPVRVLSSDELGELAKAFNEMAARLNTEESMRSDFISMLSHEIRTPLTSIRESVNLIREEVMGPVNDRQKRFLEIAANEVERITNLLTRLMKVSSLGTNPVQVEPIPISSAELVRTSVHRLLPAAQARGITIRAEVEDRGVDAIGDMTHLEQVLLNLIGNAIKYSPLGSEVTVRVEDSGKDTLTVCVSDNGPGIMAEELPHVFHRYFRGSRIKDEVDGIGLGLSISRHIIEAHGDRIWVESQPGHGSSFCFTLKCAR